MQPYEDTRDVARRVVDGLRGIPDPQMRANVLLTIRGEIDQEIRDALCVIAYELWQSGQTLFEVGLVVGLDRHTLSRHLDEWCERTGRRRERRAYVTLT